MQESREEKKNKIIQFWQHVFRDNLAIKLISCICAVLVWLLIINIDDPYKIKNIVVQVSTINEEAISSAHKVFEIKEGNTVNVRVSGKRSVIDDITADDIVATADLSELSSVNAVPVRVKLRRNRNQDVILECNQVVKIALEDMDSKLIKVTVTTTGQPLGDYTVGECVAKPNVIEITGGESVIDRVASVGVNVNVNGASEDFTKRVEPVAYDKKGNKIVSSTLSFNVPMVKVSVSLLLKKTISIRVKIKGKPAAGYEFVSVSNSPEEIEVASSEKKLQAISEIVIPIDITGFTDTSGGLEQDVNIEDYLDEGILIPKETDPNVSIKISIVKWEIKTIFLNMNQIELTHLEEGYQAEIIDTNRMVELSIRGKNEELNEIMEQDITGQIDCSGLKTGVYRLPIILSSDYDNFSIAQPGRVLVRITKSNYNNETEETEVPTGSSEPVSTSIPITSPERDE